MTEFRFIFVPSCLLLVALSQAGFAMAQTDAPSQGSAGAQPLEPAGEGPASTGRTGPTAAAERGQEPASEPDQDLPDDKPDAAPDASASGQGAEQAPAQLPASEVQTPGDASEAQTPPTEQDKAREGDTESAEDETDPPTKEATGRPEKETVGQDEDEDKDKDEEAPKKDTDKPEDELDLEPAKDDKGGQWPDFEFIARLMTGWEIENERPEPAEQPPATDRNEQQLFIQQARLKVIARMNKRVALNVSAELADGVRPKTVGGAYDEMPYLRNAYVNVRVKRPFQIRLGRFKRPFSRLEGRSTGALPFRGRGLSNRLIVEMAGWGDRAIGLMLWGRVREANLTWRAAVSNPEWDSDNDLEDQGLDALGRIVYSPVDWLSFGLNGGHKLRGHKPRGSADTDETANANALGGDVRFRTGDFYSAFEAITAQLPDEEGTPFAYGIVGYANYDIHLSEDWVLQPTLVGEYTDADTEYTDSEAIRAIFGLNLLWNDDFRIMPQVELIRPQGDENPWWNAQESYYLLLSVEI